MISSVVTPSAISARAPPRRAGEELLVAGRAGRRDRRADAAAGARDLFVARALQALLELARAVAAVDQVRVAVDQPRRDERAVEIVLGVDLQVRRQRVVGADPGDALVLGEQRAACDLAIPAPASVTPLSASVTRCACRHKVFMPDCRRTPPCSGARSAPEE